MMKKGTVWILIGLILFVVGVALGVRSPRKIPATTKTYHVTTASTIEAIFLEADWL